MKGQCDLDGKGTNPIDAWTAFVLRDEVLLDWSYDKWNMSRVNDEKHTTWSSCFCSIVGIKKGHLLVHLRILFAYASLH
jgi:hypothetical protein